MSKLFKLKEWLTIPESAKHLSIVFGEKVKDTDVFRLALDGHLKLSVNFVNKARVKIGRIVGWMDTEWHLFPRPPGMPLEIRDSNTGFDLVIERNLAPEIRDSNTINSESIKEMPRDLIEKWMKIPEKDRLGYYPMLDGLNIDGERFLTLEKEVKTIDGVWDLPMIGGERLDIEHFYQMLTGGPAVTLETLDGAFVEKPGGVMCQFQEDFDDNEYQPGSKALLRKLEEHIAIKKIKGAEAQKLLDMHKEARKVFMKERESRPNAHNYYPAGGLPEDAVIVVRTAALREFEESINNTPANTEKPLTATERNSLLTVIAGLCDYSDIKHQGRGAANQIAKMTEEIGAPVTDDTIRKILAKVPDALESRKK